MIFNNSVNYNNPVQELRDMNDIFEGILSLNWQQWISLFNEGQPPIAVLAQACRKAVAEENSLSSSHTPSISQYF